MTTTDPTLPALPKTGPVPFETVWARRNLDWEFDDGGKEAAGLDPRSSADCAVRAFAIAFGQGYLQTWDDLFAYARSRGTSLTNTKTLDEYLTAKGWTWHAARRVEWPGSKRGRLPKVVELELPAGRLILSDPTHYQACVDRVLRDTSPWWGHSVAGYWQAPEGWRPEPARPARERTAARAAPSVPGDGLPMRACVACGRAMPTRPGPGRQRNTCSARCRQRASRAARRDAEGEVAT